MIKPLDYQRLVAALYDREMPVLADKLATLVDAGLNVQRYGDIPRWLESLNALPDCQVCSITYSDVVGFESGVPHTKNRKFTEMHAALKGLMPWRKGPFCFDGVHIDTEWRSDIKWQRVAPALGSLAGKAVLDVGCGSGYHCWRMKEAGADLVVGIDPTPLFVLQYWAMQKYMQDPGVWVLPARLEDMPAKLGGFDVVFSMGVLYHRRSPFDHLQELRDTLVTGGELYLETLVIDEADGQVLVPEGRYSRMGNVWFIPSPTTLVSWLKKMKFTDIELLDVSVTSTEEQRATDWMTYYSLKDFLDTENSSKTVEGYPAPRRALIKAKT